MIKGFREFILRGNVIDLAVAVVIGAAFTAVVNSIVTNIFNPLIGALFNASSLDDALVLTIPGLDGHDAHVKFGAVVGAIITFLIVAIVVYFVFVMPINAMKAAQERRRKAGEEPAAAAATELDRLTEIRDLLQAQGRTRD
ncbi:large conductance mechanosensitive channel protein MscL [Glaciibacter flavus]|uniref:Large-conductance mechanosensitive channel n=1 Tax=Orlajensenia flava TaxID=2565934 RepID=A0A4S4G125_9MICO|nr:large conductance mechanosensitive channel protein MscL [Glaciibacter flavus]THG36085.1 large conductance mechanosensitive channel protein MscL [Glaciibacter flavus]